MKKFYFSTTSTALTDYLNDALIKGAILREKRFIFKGENVCLEIILSDDEKDKLEKVENDFYVCNFALPMSRIRMIIFDSNEQLEQTTNTANVSTIFTLKDMCVVLKLEQFNKPNLAVINNVKAEDSARFDRYLGAIAFLRYKTHGDEIVSEIFRYLDYFLGKKEMPFENFEKIKDILEGQLVEDNLRNYASNNGLTYKQKEFNKDFKQNDELLNILAQIWYYCSDESSKNISDLLQVKPYKLPAEKDFYFALGYFMGYAKFANSEEGKKIKFEFNKFDLKIIEIIFCFVFSQNLNKEIIDYIDSSRILNEHFCHLMLGMSNDNERQILINLYNLSTSYSKQQDEILRNEISKLQGENNNLSSKVEYLQNELQCELNNLNDIFNKNIVDLEQRLEKENKASEILRNEISKLQDEIKSLQDIKKNQPKRQTRSKKAKDNKEAENKEVQLPGIQ